LSKEWRERKPDKTVKKREGKKNGFDYLGSAAGRWVAPGNQPPSHLNQVKERDNKQQRHTLAAF